MTRRIWFIGLAMAITASTAMAVSLVEIAPITGETSSEGRCITPDGKYAGGISGSAGFVWDGTNGSRQPVAGSAQEAVYGIGYRYPTDGGTTELVIGGPNAGWESMNASTDGGTTWAKRRRTNTHAYAGGPSNTVAGSSTGGTIYATFQTPNSNTPNLYIDAWGGGTPGTWASAPDTKGTTTKSNIVGVSSTGVAVGRRKDAAGLYQNYVLTFNGSGGLGASYKAGLDGTNHGELWDIADDGSIAGGLSPVSDGRTGNWAYVRDMATGNVFELPRLGGSFVSTATNGIVYGVGPNGDYAVGMDYSYGMEKAVLWDLRDANPANWTATDLTQYAIDHSILGDFTGNLRRAYAVGVNAGGQPIITGWGWNATAGAVRGYVMTVPEPASLTFLALGGLLLLRRRH